ncbi:uncharacterized protein LOC103703231 [Phoenix dactylifera]|uniref:Uncharacterized protein LOC103703231 n=1 Tax=Phoenix dactylifera TaxID=42345 RepID=A0A8B9ATJ3_PHODC|nr:uncharacterized protein LOC103703231 [Phoenix dactylifera]
MKEYVCSKDTNKQLKEQIAKTIECEVGTSAETMSMQVEISSSSTNLPPMIYSRLPLVPYAWPLWPSISPNARPCHDHDDSPSMFSGSVSQFYLPPSAWFYPLLHEVSGSCSQHSRSFTGRHEDPVSIRHASGQSYRALDCSKEINVSSPQTIAAEKEENTATSNQGLLGTIQTEHQMFKSLSR